MPFPFLLPLATLGVALGGAGIAASRQRTRRKFEAVHAAKFRLGADGIVEGAEPMVLPGSPTHGALVLHGFNDTPQSMAPLAHALHEAGWTVRAPLLPGHGRALLALTESRRDRWLAHAREELNLLRATHEHVVVCGQSMGAALAVMLVSETPVDALVLLSPFIGMPPLMTLKFAAAWLPHPLFPYRASTGGDRSIHDPAARARTRGTGIVTAPMLAELGALGRAARGALPRVHTPTLYLQSRVDNRVRAEDAVRNFALLGTAEREQGWLTGCGHIITVDYCKDDVAKRTTAWCARWAGAPR